MRTDPLAQNAVICIDNRLVLRVVKLRGGKVKLDVQYTDGRDVQRIDPIKAFDKDKQKAI